MKTHYDKDHKIAKFIVCNIVVVLITLAQINELPYSLILNGLAVYIWFFGVNPIGYLVETIKGHDHEHPKV